MTIDNSNPPSNPSQALPEEGVDLSLHADPVAPLDLQALCDAALEALEQPSQKEKEKEEVASPPQPAPKTRESEQVIDDLNIKLKHLEDQIQNLEKRESEALDQYRRIRADFDNFRARQAREIQMAADQAERKLLLEFLPVMDNFERSLAVETQEMDAMRTGVELIQKQFADALRRTGVEKIQLQVGDPFDAMHAEALTTLSKPDLPDGSIAAIYEAGYCHKDQLLRAARVVVNHNPDFQAETDYPSLPSYSKPEDPSESLEPKDQVQ